MSNETTRRHRLVELGTARPRLVLWLVGIATVVLALGTLNVDVDTDPENMLRDGEPVRVRNAEMREVFGTGEELVVGIVADDEAGIATEPRLSAVQALHQRIAELDGVEGSRVISFATALPGGSLANAGSVEGATEAVQTNPLLAGNVLSADGTTAAVFVPLLDKSDANPVTAEIEAAVDELPELASLDTFVAGLPLAEEAFGEEMFIQMAIFAPIAGLLVFLLMLWFFRRLSLVASAMALAMIAVIATMGLLTGTGTTLHIMSSMIPVFLMPIAILDSVHVLSEFYDRYPEHRDRRHTLRLVFADLYRPLTFTTITTAVAFGSLAVTPIPPVRDFGIFVAIGVFLAWLLTVTFLPALVMTMSEAQLARALQRRAGGREPFLAGLLRAVGRFTARRRRAILAAFVVLAAVAVPGLTMVSVNDNPVNWFRSGSSVRTATETLNERLPGTFNANLVLTADEPDALLAPDTLAAVTDLQQRWSDLDVVGTSRSYAEMAGGPDPAGRLSAAFEQQPELVSTLVTRDATAANLQLQLNDGDNRAMRQVVDATDRHLAANRLPDGVEAEWAGETFLNMVWQDKMVNGMLVAFASTLAVVTALMVVLFRSLRWALLGILPIAWSVLIVYGTIGLIGRDYDMPMAVLSTLVLGVGVDFAIHFVHRYRALHRRLGDRQLALQAFFEEPARALTRNALIIAIGFSPLFFAGLVPYVVVATFLSTIVALSWLATLVALPAILRSRRAPAPPQPEPNRPERVRTAV